MRTFINHTDTLLKITVKGETNPIEVTFGHPFYVHQTRNDTPDEEGDWYFIEIAQKWRFTQNGRRRVEANSLD